MDKDKNKRSLLSEAAISGNKGLFETVLTTVKAKLLNDQVHFPSIPWSVCVGEENHHRMVLVVGPQIEGFRIMQHVTAAD